MLLLFYLENDAGERTHIVLPLQLALFYLRFA